MPEWSKLTTYATGFEADVARAALEEAGIPVMVQGGLTGAFGVGFQGVQPGGLVLLVPAGAEEDAREVLELDEPET